MSASLPRFEADAPPEDMIDALRDAGAIVIEELIEAATTLRLNAELDAHVEAANPGMQHLNPGVAAFYGDKTRHVAGLPGKSPTFAREIMIEPLLMQLCDAILLPACARYQLNLGHVIDRGPGAEPQWLHRDEDVWIHVPRPHPELQLATMIALEDFEPEIGATCVVPGSQAWPRERKAEPGEIAVAAMPAGSAVVYLGSTLHGAGGNTSADRWRRGLHASWIVGWLRTEENNYLVCPPDKARALPRRAQEVLGYAVHDAIRSGGGYAGMVDLRDPCDLMAAGGL